MKRPVAVNRPERAKTGRRPGRPRGVLDAELGAQTGLVVGSDLVLAGFAGLLVQLAALRISRLAAVGRRHFLLDALAEGRAGLAFTFLVNFLARFALLRVGGLGAIEIVHLFLQALLAGRADGVLTGLARLVARLLVRFAGFRVGGLGAVARRHATWPHAIHAAHSRSHATHA